MQYVKKDMVLDHVRASQIIMEIRTSNVDLNVYSTQTAPKTGLVSITNAKIHVLEFVAWTLNVELITMHRHARACRVMKEIHLLHVT